MMDCFCSLKLQAKKNNNYKSYFIYVTKQFREKVNHISRERIKIWQHRNIFNTICSEFTWDMINIMQEYNTLLMAYVPS